MYHYRKTRKVYDSFPKPESCQFCDLRAQRANLVEEFEHCIVVPNRTFYDVWERRDVQDHLLVIPKYHTDTLSSLEQHARLDIMNAIVKYEAQEYNVYARAPGSTQKSVHHQHTHLIKTDQKPARGIIHLRKPYFLIKF